MWLKDKPSLLETMAKEFPNPKEFIESIIVLQAQQKEEIAEKACISVEHYYVLVKALKDGKRIKVDLCAKIAMALKIPPKVLYENICNWEMQQYLNSIQNNNSSC